MVAAPPLVGIVTSLATMSAPLMTPSVAAYDRTHWATAASPRRTGEEEQQAGGRKDGFGGTLLLPIRHVNQPTAKVEN